jgi:predicted nucleic acid-binding protein
VSVTLDTMGMIWGLKLSKNPRPATVNPRVDEMERRVAILLDELEEDGEEIVVPNIIVSELLVGIPAADHGKFVAELQNRFFMPTYDLRAAVIAASLWQQHRVLPKGKQIARTTLKADVMIVATAKAAGVTDFYSDDEKARALATLAGLAAHDFPVRSRSLFPKTPED